MREIKTHKFNIKKGNLIYVKENPITFESVCRKYIGVIRDYDNKNSKSGVFAKGYIFYDISGNVKEKETPSVFCWYKSSFIMLGGLEGNNYGDMNKINLFKMNKKEIENLKSYLIKKQIIKNLK